MVACHDGSAQVEELSDQTEKELAAAHRHIAELEQEVSTSAAADHTVAELKAKVLGGAATITQETQKLLSTYPDSAWPTLNAPAAMLLQSKSVATIVHPCLPLHCCNLPLLWVTFAVAVGGPGDCRALQVARADGLRRGAC